MLTSNKKFDEVAMQYSDRFDYRPYYTEYVRFLEKYCTEVKTVLEIGAADGILARKWNDERVLSDKYKLLKYISVEPVEKSVAIAEASAQKISLLHCPLSGTLENTLEIIDHNEDFDVLLTSRSLHEIFINYGRNEEKLFSHLAKILIIKKPSIVIHGIVEQFIGLSKKQTSYFIEKQKSIIGHGHDPAKDYLNFNYLVMFMESEGYLLIDRAHIPHSLQGFKESPWCFGIGVFKIKI